MFWLAKMAWEPQGVEGVNGNGGKNLGSPHTGYVKKGQMGETLHTWRIIPGLVSG